MTREFHGPLGGPEEGQRRYWTAVIVKIYLVSCFFNFIGSETDLTFQYLFMFYTKKLHFAVHRIQKK
jgi:hypothetical protein